MPPLMCASAARIQPTLLSHTSTQGADLQPENEDETRLSQMPANDDISWSDVFVSVVGCQCITMAGVWRCSGRCHVRCLGVP